MPLSKPNISSMLHDGDIEITIAYLDLSDGSMYECSLDFPEEFIPQLIDALIAIKDRT